MSQRMLDDWLDAYMDYTENTEPPRLFRFWSALGVIASALQRKCCIPWGTITFYPNMYIVLVAPSGKARKGTALGVAEKMLAELEPQVHLVPEAITREALIMELESAQEMDPSPDMKSIKAHSSLTIFSPELTVFLGYNNQQLMSDLTDWYDCRAKWTYRTKHHGENVISGVWVNLIGATTPELIQATMPATAISGGLTSRMIFVYETRKGKVVPQPFVSAEGKKLYEKLLYDLNHILLMEGNFRPTRAFVDFWTEWYLAQEDNPPFDDPRFGGYFERRPNHLMKLSMLCSASRASDMILHRADIERGLDILEATEKNMPYVFAGMGQLDDSVVIHRIFTEMSLKGERTFGQLLKRFMYDVDQNRLRLILQGMKTMDYVEWNASTDTYKLKKKGWER